MALNANAIVTLEAAKQYVKEFSSANDEIIERMINSLSTQFEEQSGRKITQQTLTDYRVDGNGKYCLYLPFVPAQSVTKIDIRFSVDDSPYKVITDTSKFILKDKTLGLLELKEAVFLRGRKNILLTMSAGYLVKGVASATTTDGEMSQFQDLLLTQLKFNYKKWDANEIGVTSRTLQDGSIGFVTGSQFLKEVREGLDSLRDPRIM